MVVTLVKYPLHEHYSPKWNWAVMQILFSKKPKGLGSRLIMWATGEPFSHVALLHNGYVIHATPCGVKINSFSKFSKENTVFDSIPVHDDSDKLQRLLGKHEGSSYDVLGLLFLGISLLARKYLRIPLPKSNLWHSTGMFMCTEWVSSYLNERENPMATPGFLYKSLGGTLSDY